MSVNNNWCRDNFSPPHFTRYYLVFVLAVIATMAVIGGYNKHPDEPHHFLAAQYYINHWLPPKIGDPAVSHTYSIWGGSYLNTWGIEYLLAGKVAALLLPVIGHELISIRFFNVLIFLLLIVIYFHRCHSQHDQLIPLMVILAIPQAWYIFSYINNDAFALFLSLLIISEITYPASPLNQFLTTPSLRDKLAGGLLFGLLLGILSLSKQNYYVFLLFIGIWWLYTTITFNFTSNRKGIIQFIPKIEFNNHLIGKYLFILFIGLSVFTARYTIDMVINERFILPPPLSLLFKGVDTKLLAYQEQVADPRFKPSTRKNHLDKSYYSIHLKDKGLSYSELFSQWRWHELSFQSFVGNYGRLSILASNSYYYLMKWVYISFCLFLIISILLSHNRSNIFFMLIVSLGISFTIWISTYHSWTSAFQAQGRYLFPIIGMIGLLIFQSKQHLHNWITNAFILSLFLLSSYSFLFIALYQINK
jgi:hypothetical protein